MSIAFYCSIILSVPVVYFYSWMYPLTLMTILLFGYRLDTLSRRNIEMERMKTINNEKFTTLGEIAGGVAHEINNPLAIILGNAQTIKMRIEKGEPKMEDILRGVEKIEGTTKRITKIINSLKMIARDDPREQFVDTPVTLLVDDMKSFWGQKLVDYNINFFIDPYDETLTAYCRPVQMVLVILNLIGNSFHAIKDSKEKWIRIKITEFQNDIEIRVVDSGRGIPEDIRKRIFDPFFTTKPVGEGTGLGLSLSQGVMKVNRGSLTLDADYPNTCFVMTLPKGKRIAKIA